MYSTELHLGRYIQQRDIALSSVAEIELNAALAAQREQEFEQARLAASYLFAEDMNRRPDGYDEDSLTR